MSEPDDKLDATGDYIADYQRRFGEGRDNEDNELELEGES